MPTLKRLLRWSARSGVALYSAGATALALAWSVAPQATWWIALSNVFALYFFAPLLALLPAAALARSRLLLAMLAAPTLAFLALFGGAFVPRLAPAPGEGRDLRVATINQLYRGQRPELLLEAIRREGPDVVAIQELHPAVAELLERELGAEYPHQHLSPEEGPGGMGLISRFPISAVAPAAGRSEAVTLEVDGRQLTVVNVHIHFSGISRVRSERFFGLPYLRMYDMYGRQTQVEELIGALEPVQGPLVVLGDFNTGDREPGYTAMAGAFRDVYRETSAGFGFTFPYQRQLGPLYLPVPLVRIDYIWARGPLAPRASAVRCVEGSDHCMVVADLRLAAP